MSVKIPGVPQNGGDLAKYLTTVEDEVGWVPQGATALGRDLAHALDGNQNDPATWVAFAGSALQTVWEAMPADIRSQLQLVLRDLVDMGLARVQDVVSLSAQAAVSTAADAVPLIGTIIKAALIVINASVDYAKQIDDQNRQASTQNYWAQRYATIRSYTHPNALVYQQMHVLNYFDYSAKGNEWRLRPCFDRSSGAADRVMLGSSGLADKGSCGKGVLLDCPGGSFFDWDDCHFKNQSDTACYRRLGVSSLFYPFWSPAYADAGIPAAGGSDDRLNPNLVMAANQTALIANPSMNLRVDGKRLLQIRDRFQDFFLNQVRLMGGVIEISNGHAPGGGKLTIAPSREENYVPTQSRRDKFYFTSEGLIAAYPNTGVDLNSWGVRITRGPQTPQYAAVSVAQYNAVIGATLAFMSARANFLRAGALMSALLQDYGADAFDSSVRAAMRYSADYGKQIPAPAPARMKKAPARMKKLIVGAIPASPGSSGGGGGGLALVGAAAAAVFLLKR